MEPSEGSEKKTNKASSNGNEKHSHFTPRVLYNIDLSHYYTKSKNIYLLAAKQKQAQNFPFFLHSSMARNGYLTIWIRVCIRRLLARHTFYSYFLN